MAQLLAELGVNVNNGFGNLLEAIQKLPDAKRSEIEADIQAAYKNLPDLAMVNSNKGITNLHVPSDVIVDASMPAMIRTSGQMWNKEDKPQDTIAVIPDASYAGVYEETIAFCKENGAFDPRTMGTVPNVGLMAQQAEEYGSHDKTFEIPADGTVRVIDDAGSNADGTRRRSGRHLADVPGKGPASPGLGETRCEPRASDQYASRFLARPESIPRCGTDQEGKQYLKNHDTSGLQIEIMSPVEATRFTLKRLKAGQDTISVTGNVLRDYLTDLFPILEVGTSAKMLSIVPLDEREADYLKRAREDLHRSTCSNSTKRIICDGTRWANSWLSPFARTPVEKTGNRRAKILATALGQSHRNAAGKPQIAFPESPRTG